ncbi:hypothetical protein C2W62_35540 [Candidatus Entotheonella serta]|nr:hypothetical protein C2W62_35540 [Candidatus Entotheonella serta]
MPAMNTWLPTTSPFDHVCGGGSGTCGWLMRFFFVAIFLLLFLMFTAASILCGLARSLEMMILARILQGIGGGGLIPVAQAIMLETFPEEERGMAMAIYLHGHHRGSSRRANRGGMADGPVWLALDLLY